MSIDHSDEVGWPAEATAVHQDSARIFPRLVREERRQQQKTAQIAYHERNETKVAAKARARMSEYRTGPNRERYLELRRAREKANRA